MSRLKIRQALEVALASITPSIDTVYENKDYKPVIGKSYQKVFLLMNPPTNPTFGDTLTRYTGVLKVILCYPTNGGAKIVTARAEMIEALFKRGRSFSNDGVTVISANTPSIGNLQQAVDHIELPVTGYFWCDVIA